MLPLMIHRKFELPSDDWSHSDTVVVVSVEMKRGKLVHVQ